MMSSSKAIPMKWNSMDSKEYLFSRDFDLKRVVLILYLKAQDTLTTAIGERQGDSYLASSYMSLKNLYAIMKPFLSPALEEELTDRLQKIDDLYDKCLTREITIEEKIHFSKEVQNVLGYISMAFDRIGIVLEEKGEEEIT